MNRRPLPFVIIWLLLLALLTVFALQAFASGNAQANPTVEALVTTRFAQTAQAEQDHPTLEPTAAFEATVDAAFAQAVSATLTAAAPTQPAGEGSHRDIFRVPLEQTESARIVLDIPLAEAFIRALDEESEDLFVADVTYIGAVDFYSVGEAEKYISLTNPLHTLPLTGIREDLPWVVGLSPAVDLDLSINCGVGRNNTFDLTGLQFEALVINSGVGDVAITLPASVESYPAAINGGAGSLTLTIPDGAAVNLTINGGVGAFTLILGAETAVRLEASWGVGSIDIADRLATLDLDTYLIGGEGIWQTPDFEDAPRQVTIAFSGGVGNLTIR